MWQSYMDKGAEIVHKREVTVHKTQKRRRQRDREHKTKITKRVNGIKKKKKIIEKEAKKRSGKVEMLFWHDR